MGEFVVFNVVECEPSAQDALATELGARAREAETLRPDGFAGTEVLRAENGASVVTITRWRDRAAFQAFRARTGVQESLRQLLAHHPKATFLESILRLPKGR